MPVIQKLHFSKRRLKKLGFKLISAGICATLIVLSAPYVSDKLEGLTAASASVSFQSGEDFLAEYNGKADIGDDIMENFSINGDSGSLAEPEAQSDPVPPTQTQPQQENTEIPPRPDNAGSVLRKTLSAGSSGTFVPVGKGYVKNGTSLSYQEIQSIAGQKSSVTLESTSEPQVLIYHTHATETYLPYPTDWFDRSFNARSADDNNNMVAVGNVLEEKLKAAGIGVVHDKEHYDASYVGAYDRSRVNIEKYLKQYPSIKVVLDVHRDAIGSDPITAPVTTINGISTAQIMIISCAGTKSKAIPNYKQNLNFACALQNQMETDYPTLTRPILFGNRHYNQDLSAGALLLEVGGHGNTLQEAKNAISFAGDSLIRLLKPS